MKQISEVYNCDCMDFMAGLPDGYFDILIADVPYGISESKKQGRGARSTSILDKRNGRRHAVKTYHQKKEWDSKQPGQDMFNEFFRVSKKHFIFGENYLLFEQKAFSSGRIFWDKVNGNCDFSDGELIWTNCIKSVRQIEYMWSGMFQGKSLSEGRVFNGDNRARITRIHPTEKPVLIYKYLLNQYAKPGNKIFDPMMGSQSSRIAAWDMGFPYWGCEKDSDYFVSGCKRFKAHMQQHVLFAAEQMYNEQTNLFK